MSNCSKWRPKPDFKHKARGSSAIEARLDLPENKYATLIVAEPSRAGTMMTPPSAFTCSETLWSVSGFQGASSRGAELDAAEIPGGTGGNGCAINGTGTGFATAGAPPAALGEEECETDGKGSVNKTVVAPPASTDVDTASGITSLNGEGNSTPAGDPIDVESTFQPIFFCGQSDAECLPRHHQHS